jgi:hypothetical protein
MRVGNLAPFGQELPSVTVRLGRTESLTGSLAHAQMLVEASFRSTHNKLGTEKLIYLVALAVSVFACAQTVASVIVDGNVIHVKNGREPNAGVSLLPMIPLFQLLALGIAWVLDRFIPSMAIGVFLGCYTAFSAAWLASFKRSKAELDRLLTDKEHERVN